MAIYRDPRFLLAGDRAITIELADEIDVAVNARVRALAAALHRARIPGIVDLVPTYRSLLVYYDPLQLRASALRDRVLNLPLHDEGVLPAPRLLEIPTCYGGVHGPDMPFVIQRTGLAQQDLVRIHTSTDYLVYMMGFNTGFPYLGGMSQRIAVPRLETPRTRIPAGSVAIAQQQTGIYPVESPGGWRIIGRSPLRLFDPHREPPVAIEAGDYIRFTEIDDITYRTIEAAVQAGRYEPRVGARHS
jgi:KipI family sensor histidine kinase inhibitor